MSKKNKVPPIVAPSKEELTNEALSEIARDLAGAPQIITQQSDDYAQIVIEKKFIAIHRVPQVGGDACYIWYKDGLKKRYQNEASELPLLFKPSEKESIIQRLKEQGAGECLLVEFTVNMREWLYRKSYNTANAGITTEGDILYKKLLKKVRKLGMTTFSLCQQGELIMHSHDDKGKPIHIGIGELKITLQDGTETVILPDGKRDVDKEYLHVLFTETADGQITYYRSEVPKQTVWIKNQAAEVFTQVEAQAKTVFADEDGCTWQIGRVNRNAAKEETNKRTSEIKETVVSDSVITTLTTTDENGKSDSTTSIKPRRGVMFGMNQFSMEAEPDETKVITLPKEDLAEMLNNLPENRPLYKDSGSWQIRTDDMEEVLYEQGANEAFFDFIKRAYSKENFFKE